MRRRSDDQILPRRSRIFAVRQLIACAAFAMTAGCTAQSQSFDLIAHSYRQSSHAPAVVMGILLPDGRTVTRASGLARLPSGPAVTSKTFFHMASVTKPFVATSILQLVEQGKIDLDAPLVRYLPYFRIADDRYRQITIRQMVNHSSGLPHVEDYGWDRPEYDDGALERYVRSLGQVRLVSAPGTGFHYSDMAYNILGDVIAKVSGQPFEDYVSEKVLRPIGMTNSTLLLQKAPAGLMASPHVPGDGGQTNYSRIFPYNRPHAGSSTLYSNVDEMLLWARAVLGRGRSNGKTILSERMFALQTHPTDFEIENPDLGKYHPRMGLGWFLLTINGETMIWHRGQDVGFTTNVLIAPGRKAAVVAMSNILTEKSGMQLFDMCVRALLEATT